MSIVSKQKKVKKYLSKLETDCNYNGNFYIDINDDGDMAVDIEDYELIFIGYNGDDIPMSFEAFQELLKLFKSLKPIPDSGGKCTHFFDYDYTITLKVGDETLDVLFYVNDNEFLITYTQIMGEGKHDDEIFKCESNYFIEDTNNLLKIFEYFINFDVSKID